MNYQTEDIIEPVDAEIGHLSSGVAIEALNRAEVDVQITTAKRYPRSIKEFRRTAMELATLDEEVAASMFYSLPRAGKRIEGPSARLAEVIAYSWGNIRAEADVVAIDDRFITAMGSCFDLERNYASRIRVKRQITDSKGRRYPDDMIRVTGQAACSIALREAVFKVVPRSLFKDVYEAARATSIGKALSMEKRRQNAFEWFNKAGVSEDRVLGVLERKGVEEVSIDDLITLKGLQTAIKDGDVSLEEAFPIEASAKAQDQTKARVAELKDRLASAGKPTTSTASSTSAGKSAAKAMVSPAEQTDTPDAQSEAPRSTLTGDDGPELDEFEHAVFQSALQGGDANQRQRNELGKLADEIYGVDTEEALAVRSVAATEALGKDQVIQFIGAARSVLKARQARPKESKPDPFGEEG